MFAWATKEYILQKMTLKQVLFYYEKGWEAKQTEAKVHWGTYGKMMSDSDSKESQTQKTPIEEIRRYAGYENAYYDENGKLRKE